MIQTTQTILPYLQLAAGPLSGVIASWLFSQLRRWFPQATAPAWLATLLYAPRYARIGSLVLAAVVALVASVLVAALTAGDLPAVFDAALAASIAGIASQLTHAAQLAAVPPPVTRPTSSTWTGVKGPRV